MAQKENDMFFIKKLTQITVTEMCNIHNVNRGNVISGVASEEKIHLIKKELEKAILKLLLEDKENGN